MSNILERGREGVPSFPLSHPPLSFFGSRPIFYAGKTPKTPFLCLCSQTPRKRLLRRLVSDKREWRREKEGSFSPRAFVETTATHV